MKRLTASDRWIIVIPTLLFWLFVPFPFWLLGAGFAGQLVFLPDVWDLLSILWVVAFYTPLALIGWVAIDAIRSSSKDKQDA